MTSKRKRRPTRGAGSSHKASTPREIPFYRVLPAAALHALEKGLEVRNMEDKFATSFANGHFDVYHTWAPVHLYRVIVRKTAGAVEMGPALLMAPEPPGRGGLDSFLDHKDEDEEHLITLDLIVRRVMGEDTGWVLFNAQLRAWTAQIVREFRRRGAPKRGRRGSSPR